MTKEGPKVIEYNVRLGDPETQVVLPRVESDFAELIDAAINDKQLPELKISDKAYLNVVVAGAGYPKQAVKGQALPKLESQKTYTPFMQMLRLKMRLYMVMVVEFYQS